MKPNEVAEKGQKIYDELLKDRLEPEHIGRYVVIDTDTKEYSIADTPDQAIELAQAKSPNGMFHLVRIGFPGAYHFSSIISGTSDWEF